MRCFFTSCKNLRLLSMTLSLGTPDHRLRSSSELSSRTPRLRFGRASCNYGPLYNGFASRRPEKAIERRGNSFIRIALQTFFLPRLTVTGHHVALSYSSCDRICGVCRAMPDLCRRLCLSAGAATCIWTPGSVEQGHEYVLLL